MNPSPIHHLNGPSFGICCDKY